MNKENSRFRIAVVDDDELFARKICRIIQQFWDPEKPAVKIFKSGTGLADCLKQGLQYDIYFLDIEMPGISGLNLAESIMRLSSQSYIVLITSYERYALQSIKIGAFYYILKEEYDRELKKVLQKICMEESRKRQTKSFLVGKSSAYEKVCLDDIFYIERNGKDAVFYCSGAQYVERKPLKTVFSELPETEFAYINSGQIVNLMRIAEFNKDEVKLDSGAVLHCSRRMKKDFEAKMLAFWERL